jgi:hypothetical protein
VGGTDLDELFGRRVRLPEVKAEPALPVMKLLHKYLQSNAYSSKSHTRVSGVLRASGLSCLVHVFESFSII